LRPALAVAVLAALAVAFAPGPVTAQTSFDITGVWDCCGAGGAFPSSWTLTALDQSTGEFSGTGSGGAYTWPTTGRIEGNSLTITTGPYNELPSYTATWTATLAADGQSMTGSWSDTNGQSGTFTTTKSRSIPAPVPGKNVTAVPLSGTVTVKQPGSSQFVPLTTVDSVPVGSTVDVTNGRIALTAEPEGQGGGRAVLRRHLQDRAEAGEEADHQPEPAGRGLQGLWERGEACGRRPEEEAAGPPPLG
jgi:hypothetical protein